jgi:hypothetical protein
MLIPWKPMVIALLLGWLAPAVAADPMELAEPEESAAPEAPSPWQFEVMGYAWISGAFGSATVKGNTVQFAVTPGDLFNLLFQGNAFAGAVYFSAAYDRFFMFVDTDGGYLEASVNQRIPTQLCTLTVAARDKLFLNGTAVAFGYQLGQWTLPGRSRPFTLGVFAGTRYQHFGNHLSARVGVIHGAQAASNVSQAFNWADPMIGVRWSLPVLDSVSLDFRGTIGGFHASSNLIWGLLGHVKYWLPWKPYGLAPYVAAGYQVAAFDRSNSAGNIQLQFRGPMTGLGFTF